MIILDFLLYFTRLLLTRFVVIFRYNYLNSLVENWFRQYMIFFFKASKSVCCLVDITCLAIYHLSYKNRWSNLTLAFRLKYMITSIETNDIQLPTIATNIILAHCHTFHKPLSGLSQGTFKFWVSIWLFLFNLVEEKIILSKTEQEKLTCKCFVLRHWRNVFQRAYRAHFYNCVFSDHQG